MVGQKDNWLMGTHLGKLYSCPGMSLFRYNFPNGGN